MVIDGILDDVKYDRIAVGHINSSHIKAVVVTVKSQMMHNLTKKEGVWTGQVPLNPNYHRSTAILSLFKIRIFRPERLIDIRPVTAKLSLAPASALLSRLS